MKKRFFIPGSCVPVILLSIAPLAGYAQTGSPRIATSTSSLPGGAVQLVIENNADQAVTAYAYTVTFLSGGKPITGERFYDSSIFLAQRPIPPHQTRTEQQGGPGITNVQYAFEAAVFADGTSFGAPDWAQRILSRRQFAGQALGRIQQLLSTASGSGTVPETVVSQLNAYLASRLAASSNADEREMEQRFTGIVIQNLRQLSQSGKAPADVLSRTSDVVSKAQARLTAGH